MAFRTLIIAALMTLWAPPALTGEAGDIEALLEAQARAWNNGNLEAFMALYWRSDELRFASGDVVTYGWEATLAAYKARYSTPEKMGKLEFRDLDIKILSESYALVFGRFEVDRKVGDLEGLFTLLMEKRLEGWRIIADHSSESPLPQIVLGEEP